jgi:hypothetical protein
LRRRAVSPPVWRRRRCRGWSSRVVCGASRPVATRSSTRPTVGQRLCQPSPRDRRRRRRRPRPRRRRRLPSPLSPCRQSDGGTHAGVPIGSGCGALVRPARRSFGWGPKGRWFKSSRADLAKPPQLRRFRTLGLSSGLVWIGTGGRRRRRGPFGVQIQDLARPQAGTWCLKCGPQRLLSTQPEHPPNPPCAAPFNAKAELWSGPLSRSPAGGAGQRPRVAWKVKVRCEPRGIDCTASRVTA